jgi:hypothetical protein
MFPPVAPQLVENAGMHALKRAIAEPDRSRHEREAWRFDRR